MEQELGVTYHPNPEALAKVCDVVTINCPLHPVSIPQQSTSMLRISFLLTCVCVTHRVLNICSMLK
jgi:lactate dehydrogenase-like 2-hydroxyacid dehydrogenase